MPNRLGYLLQGANPLVQQGALCWRASAGCRPVKPHNGLRAGLPVVVEADERFFCAMSGRLLTEPVRHSSGVTCDRLALNDWFSAGGPRRGRQLTHHLSRPACMLYIANGAQCFAAQDDQLF